MSLNEQKWVSFFGGPTGVTPARPVRRSGVGWSFRRIRERKGACAAHQWASRWSFGCASRVALTPGATSTPHRGPSPTPQAGHSPRGRGGGQSGANPRDTSTPLRSARHDNPPTTTPLDSRLRENDGSKGGGGGRLRGSCLRIWARGNNSGKIRYSWVVDLGLPSRLLQLSAH